MVSPEGGLRRGWSLLKVVLEGGGLLKVVLEEGWSLPGVVLVLSGVPLSGALSAGSCLAGRDGTGRER